MPRIRTEPEDFKVEEILHEEPSGEGPHTYLWVEKRRLDTQRCAEGLARLVGLPEREVGYAGRKDRHAVTRQWFSLPALDPERALELELPGVRVLKARRHPDKLRLGHLSGNRFRLRVREVSPEQAEQAREALRTLESYGMPNRYGRQRFGNDGANARRGAAILAGGKVRGGRRTAMLMVSALQGAVFNEVLTRRPLPPHALLVGDLALVHATDDWIRVDDPDSEKERLANFSISPTGPIFGTKMKRPRGEVAKLEEEAMAVWDVPDPRTLRLPRGLRLYGGRRSLRARLGEVAAEVGENELHLSFTLPSGSYATVLLEEIFPEGFEEGALRDPATDQS